MTGRRHTKLGKTRNKRSEERPGMFCVHISSDKTPELVVVDCDAAFHDEILEFKDSKSKLRQTQSKWGTVNTARTSSDEFV